MSGDLRQVRPAILEVGSRVTTGIGGTKKATVSFIGDTQFATGEWIGLTYDGPDGKNDGSQGGIFYFRCKPAHGAFVKRVSATSCFEFKDYIFRFMSRRNRSSLIYILPNRRLK